MTGTTLGLLLGVGLFFVWWSFWPQEDSGVREGRVTPLDRLRDELVQAGWGSVSLFAFLFGSVVAGLVVGFVMLLLTAVPAMGLLAAVAGGYLPFMLVRARARRRRRQLRDVWPDVVDHIASAVRAGMALPESLAQLAVRGPVELRPVFADFAQDYRTTGRFSECLDALKARLADPVADRIIEALRIAREVGGSDLGRLLRTLSTFLRDDARTRAELEARQTWTVNAARLATAAPWVALLFMGAGRPDTLAAYRQPAGVTVLVVGAIVTLIAYQIMRRIGRLPEEARVMR